MEDVVSMQPKLLVEFEDTGLTELPAFYKAKHVAYIKELADELSRETSYEGAVTEHLRMSGVYWSLTVLHILLEPEEVDALMGVTKQTNVDNTMGSTIVDWVWTCYDSSSGSFGGNTKHQGHLLYTLSALQILAVSGQMESERLLSAKTEIISFISSLQQSDGSFVGDRSSLEIDTRFAYCAFQSLALLGSLANSEDASSVVDVNKAMDYIMLCRNLDGGFGSCQGAESHAGQVFCCVGALAIAGGLDRLQVPAAVDVLPWWLAERQVDSGGLNGRPEKQADVCYSWWILSSLSILGKVDWINTDKLANYILKCQDDEDGGIADRPEDMADVFHTFFGVAGLSLLGYLPSTHRPIDPLYALPTDVVQSLNLPGQVLACDEGSVSARLRQYSVASA